MRQAVKQAMPPSESAKGRTGSPKGGTCCPGGSCKTSIVHNSKSSGSRADSSNPYKLYN